MAGRRIGMIVNPCCHRCIHMSTRRAAASFTPAEEDRIRAYASRGERLGLCVESPTRQFQEAAVAEQPTEFWGALAIDPVEIALPSGSGFTLRAYRASTAVEGTDISDREPEDDVFANRTPEY